MTATGGKADVKGKRKREMDDGNQKFTGEQHTFEPPKRTTREKLMNYSILQDCQAVASDRRRQRWLSKCAYAVQEALPANEKDNDDDTCVPAFIGHLLASFETSAHQELRIDLERYSAVMEQLLSNIEKFNPSNAPKKKLLKRTHDTNDREDKKLRKTEAEWLCLDRYGHALVTDDGGVVPWTATGVTRHGVSIKLSLCVQEPPCISWLLFMAEVPHSIILSSSVTHDVSYFQPPRSMELSVLVVSSHEKTLLLEAFCAGTRDYLVMDLVVPPVLTCLPPLCTWEMEIQGRKGIMRREDSGGYVVVAVLEQGLGKGESWHLSFFSTSSSSSAGGAWRRKPARLAPDQLHDWPCWEISTELACDGRFWWVDLRRGMLSCSCDSLLEERNGAEETMPLALEFTPLPNVSMDEAKGARFSDYDLQQDRCVMASGGPPDVC
ncbi:hypothetical protein EJB05_30434 [Eragrostis curvula]|uniref:DUF1618 domain-containing protein n=1 Tax=Eragrostis curvula TaxID=38414 RepID=A0A5J9UBH0_9POAL|nr:hypothetical protein EJB05_30434 [Eragrostis curvula]